MKVLTEILKWVASVAFAILAPLLIIVIGAVLVGIGIVQQWQWLVYAGAFLAIFGAVWISKEWLGAD